MSTDTVTDPEAAVKAASSHLYEAMTHHYGPLDLSAHQPIVKAISEYGQRSREHDEAGVAQASTRIYEALTHHFGPQDHSANDRVVKSLSEYGKACRDAGVK